MSFIVVTGIPTKWSLKAVVKQLASTIRSHFEAVAFTNIQKLEKDCYLRLSSQLNQDHVVECINKRNFGPFKLEAFIPDHIPNNVMSAKPKKMPKKLRHKFNIPIEGIPEGILKATHLNILKEMQFKYPGLFPLFQKTKYVFYRALSKIVYERLVKILEANPESRETSFFLSKFYRRSHPHFGDFQLILSTLHEVEQSLGMPRSQISENTLSAVRNTSMLINNLPVDKVKNACSKYSKKIINKVAEHINSLDVTLDNNANEEDIVRNKVRQELKKMSPFVPEIIRQVISNNFIMPQPLGNKIHLYGEPFLPNKEVMKPFLKGYHALNVIRSKYMYNLIMFEILPQHYDRLMAEDGVLLKCGAKLIIRRANLPVVRHNDKGNTSGSVNQEPDQEDDLCMDVEDEENLY